MSPSQTFPIALTAEAHDHAQQASLGQPNGVRAKQAYLNALARFAVSHYLHCMGLDSQPEVVPPQRKSDAVVDALSESTALGVANLGELECCAVEPGAAQITVPPDAIWDRIGYVAVQLESSLTKAEILGFSSQLEQTNRLIEISKLYSLEALLKHLHALHHAQDQAIPINLTHWFQNTFEQGWQICHDLLRTASLEPAMSFRGSPCLTGRKSLPLGESLQEPIDLVITLIQKPDHRTQIEIQIISPNATDLPPGLTVSILDEQGQTFLEQGFSSPSPALILQPFMSAPGERFALTVRLGEAEFHEQFIA